MPLSFRTSRSMAPQTLRTRTRRNAPGGGSMWRLPNSDLEPVDPVGPQLQWRKRVARKPVARGPVERERVSNAIKLGKANK